MAVIAAILFAIGLVLRFVAVSSWRLWVDARCDRAGSSCPGWSTTTRASG
jgi:hypothetical protein